MSDQTTRESKTITVLPERISLPILPAERGGTESEVTLVASNFGPKKSKDFMTISFDTEFVGPEEPVTRQQINDGKAKNVVLSYQFHCRMMDGKHWSGIIYPTHGSRITLGDFVHFALGAGVRDHGPLILPRHIYLVGHFTRADIPTFADFGEIQKSLSNIRNTFVSVDRVIKLSVGSEEATPELRVSLRDTMLLAPTDRKSLDAIGDMLGVPKVPLRNNPTEERAAKKRMDDVLSKQFELFEMYASRDAKICSDFAWTIIDQNYALTGNRSLPVTLTSMGLKLVDQHWKKSGFKPEAIVGRETVKERVWQEGRGRFLTTSQSVFLPEVSLHERAASEAYHGGRAEQFWFGSAFESNWVDYDLASAYPTAMSKIGMPDWKNIEITKDVSQFGIDTLGCARVRFKFPSDVRFPTMPVRTDNGLVFPLAGESYCCAPEIALALHLGAEIEILHGVIVPCDRGIQVFHSFIVSCLEKRAAFPKGSFQNLYWKETVNSIYGKTAQGLLRKRIYNLKTRETEQLPQSKITNPFFAGYITSYVRAVLGEIMNRLPRTVCVFSCTTDGFLCNASEDERLLATSGPLAVDYSKARAALTGNEEVLEIKHKVRVPLGWRARGQATLVPGTADPALGDDGTVILAKGGIYLPEEFDTRSSRNDETVRMFRERQPRDVVSVISLTGIRDIVERGADLVGKITNRRLNMEYDWKRQPLAAAQHPVYGHVCFSTAPWETVEQFYEMRYLWERYTSKSPMCVKSIDDYRRLAHYVDSYELLTEEERRHRLEKAGPDLHRLRSLLCWAWHGRDLGVGPVNNVDSAQSFANALSYAGLPANKDHVQNAKYLKARRKSVPRTDRAVAVVKRLSDVFVDLKTKEIFADVAPQFLIRADDASLCPFISVLALEEV